MEITMHKYKDMDLKGATLINGFPSGGLMNSIVASYLINALNLDQICGLDADEFPPIAMVYDSKPKFPARIYASEEAKLVVFMSEFTPLPEMARDIARKVLSFTEDTGCSRIISPETNIIEKEGFELFGIGSTDAAREELKQMDINPLIHSMIAGISGVLLNEGKIRNINVIVPIALRGPETSDARTAAHVVEIIHRMIPTIKIDMQPLYQEAEGVEKYLKSLRKQAAKPEDHYDMYS
ncbi:MAG: PAC2 family protein [ANME-2 cluster archaeon]|nr:PAC2 family protein [ANME-2 cluster archaeon]